MSADPSERLEPSKPEPKKQSSSRSGSKGPRKGKASVPAGFGKGAYVDMSRVRHQARVLAMQALYERDLTEHDLQEILERMRSGDDVDLPASAKETTDEDETQLEDIPQPVADRATAIVHGITEHQDGIDPLIEKAAPHFPIPQLAAIDRNVLRLAIYELLYAPDVPYKVVINEAVEIAKRFGGPNSGRFVNGVLGTISKDLPAKRKHSSR
jgi:N utilization substance protein B